MNVRNYIFNITVKHIIIGLLLMVQPLNATISYPELLKRYTKDNPVVVVADWEHAPYQFLDDNGNPSGYSVEVFEMILNELNLPHEHIFGEWKNVLPRFWNPANTGNLTLEPQSAIARTGLYYSQIAVLHYRLAVVSHKEAKEIRRFDSLPKERGLVFIKERDYGDVEAKRRGWTSDERIYANPLEAINHISTNKDSYFVWGYTQLNRIIKNNNRADELRITPLIDVRSMPVVFSSYDKELINAVEQTYDLLLRKGKFDALYTKYFNPEEMPKRTSPYVIYLIIFIVIVAIALVTITFIMLRKYRKSNFKVSQYNEALEIAMESNKFEIYIFDIKKQVATQFLPTQSRPGDSYTLEEYLSHIPAQYKEMIVDKLNLLVTGKIDSTHFHYNWKDSITSDEAREINFSIASIKDNLGKPIRLIAATKDTTSDIKRAMVLEQYKQVFESSFFGVALYDKDGAFIDINHEGEQNNITGLMISSDLRNNLFSYPTIINYYDRFSKEPFSYCKIIENDSGEKSYFEMGIQALFDDDGNPMYYAVSSLNVTEERELVVALQKLETNINNTAEQLRLYEDQLCELLIRNNAWMYVYDIDDHAFRFFRRHDEPERIFEAHDYYKMIEEGDSLRNTIGAITDRKKLKEFWGKEYTILYKALSFIDRNDTKYHYYKSHGLPKTLENGRITGTYGIIQDVTERYEMEEQLKNDTEKALRAGQAKSAFLASISHEIRTPLNAIVGFSSMLNYMDDNAERDEAVRIIQGNCEMLIRLISDIKVMSDLDKGVFEIKPRDVDFASIFVRTAQSLAQQFVNPNVQFSYESPYETMPMFIDIDRVMQVLVNFTTNSRKHTAYGHVKIGYMRKDGGIYIYCEDTGTGIPEDKRDAVFRRFVKLDEYVQGTGLGLYICKGIATSMGGNIGVDSEEGKGSTFWLWVPEAEQATEN